MKFIFNAFTADEIISRVNDTLATQGSRIRAKSLLRNEYNQIILKTTRGAQLFVLLGRFSQSTFFIRAIHRIKDKFKNYTYLPNGQCGKNLDTIVFLGESGIVYNADTQTYKAYLKNIFPEMTDTKLEDRVALEAKANQSIAEALAS
jgi:hypothetical protein